MRRVRSFSITLITITLLLLVSHIQVASSQQPKPDGSRAAPAADSTTGPQFAERYPRYELRPDDVLDVTFAFTPEFNQTVTVQPDGYISLRNLSDIHVAGKTLPEVTQTIREIYSSILQHPVISIMLKDFEKPYVVVGGQVGHPGKYDLRGDMTVTEAIAVAGGFSNSAKHSQVVLYRRISPDLYEAKVINVKKLMKSRDLREDTHLKPGDTLFVPQSALSKIRQFVPSPGFGLGATF